MQHMEISAMKTKVMALFAGGMPASTCVCNGVSVEQVSTFNFNGLHLHDSRTLPLDATYQERGSWL